MIKFFVSSLLLILLLVPAQAEPAPTIMFSNLLKEVKLDHQSGRFRIGTMTALFLPPPVRPSKQIYKYNPADGGKLDAILSRDGQSIAKFKFYGQLRKEPFWLLNSNELDGGSASDFRLQQAGTYSLDFQIEGKTFLKFPFSVEVLAGDDPYSPGSIYLMDGAWSDYGYLFYGDANPSQSLMFKTWLRYRGKVEGHPYNKIRVELTDSAGNLIGFEEGDSYHLRSEWNRYEFRLGNDKGALQASQLLAKDGDYSITLKIDGKLYGTYKLKVSGGKILRQGRADRAATDPLDFIEGGKDAWWLKRQ